MDNNTSDGVEVISLSVDYSGHAKALGNVDLWFGRGLSGLLGPNGAGKTTLMRTLATLQKPSRGVARVFGHCTQDHAAEVRRLLGYLPQDFRTYPQLRAWEVLDYYGILNGMTNTRARRNRTHELLERVGMGNLAHRKVGQLSGGMVRRLGVAQALLNDPRVLILDEPTVGLDPAERIRFRTFLAELSRDRVVLLSTHIVTDIGSSCENLVVIDEGEVRFKGHRQGLIEGAMGRVWTATVQDAEYEAFRAQYLITAVADTPHGTELRFLADTRNHPEWRAVEPTLEDAYLCLLGSNRHKEVARA